MDSPGNARVVRRCLVRDDGGDDAPVGRPDGRSLLEHDADAFPLSPPSRFPSRRAAVAGTTAVLTTLGVLLLTAPGALPGLTAPDDRPMAPMAP
jgi:hypothetical protein